MKSGNLNFFFYKKNAFPLSVLQLVKSRLLPITIVADRITKSNKRVAFSVLGETRQLLVIC